MKILLVLNDPPYGSERCYNGLRVVNAMAKNNPSAEATVFLMADAASVAFTALRAVLLGDRPGAWPLRARTSARWVTQISRTSAHALSVKRNSHAMHEGSPDTSGLAQRHTLPRHLAHTKERNTTMRIMTRLAAAALLAIAAGGWSAHAEAQTEQAPGTSQVPGAATPGMKGMPEMMGGDMGRMMEMMRGRMAAQAAMRSLQHIEGQLAYYRTELGITDAQQPQWNAFADAVRVSAQKLRQAYGQVMKQGGQPASVPAQLEQRIATLTVLLESTRTIAAAAAPLYAALSDEQKHTADGLLAEHLQDMRVHGL
jgi:hypothetical protein